MKPEPTTTPASAGATVEYQVRFAVGGKGRKRVRAATDTAASVAKPAALVAPPSLPPRPKVTPPAFTAPTPTAPPSTPNKRVSPLAIRLVLGHYFERLVREGLVRDYAEIARRTGLTRARVAQIADFALLSPQIQMRILSAAPNHLTEKYLRRVLAARAW